MDDFFKTKVGFTIGLLASIFAFKPLVDANANIGFSIFNVKITVEYAYVFLTSFLGLAIYFISLQFASEKHVGLLDKISNACYSIALATPIVFIVCWLTTIILNFVAQNIKLIPDLWISMAISLIMGFFSNTVYRFLMKSIKGKSLEAEKKQERKEDIEVLSRAQELYTSGMYDMSVLESSKVIESIVRRLLELRGISITKGHMYELVKLSEEHRILNKADTELLNEIRQQRNASVHSIDSIDQKTAKRILALSRELIVKLDTSSESFGYEWLDQNRENVLKSFRSGSNKKCKEPIAMLKTAWANRDGSVSHELAEFFEVALINYPRLIIDMFIGEEELLDSWLSEVEVQLFTDFIGGNKSRLEHVHYDIVASLNQYISEEPDNYRKEIAMKILPVIASSEIREID